MTIENVLMRVLESVPISWDDFRKRDVNTIFPSPERLIVWDYATTREGKVVLLKPGTGGIAGGLSGKYTNVESARQFSGFLEAYNTHSHEDELIYLRHFHAPSMGPGSVALRLYLKNLQPNLLHSKIDPVSEMILDDCLASGVNLLKGTDGIGRPNNASGDRVIRFLQGTYARIQQLQDKAYK